MIKAIWAAQRVPGMSDEAFYRHWGEVHGGLGRRVVGMRRYVQHHTLAEARGGGGVPVTHDGASVAWFADLGVMRESFATPEWQAMGADSPNLFDPAQPMAVAFARERVIVDGPTTPTMVKLIAVVRRAPGLAVAEFQQRWAEGHGALGARLPGLRRLVQNHALPEAYEGKPSMTHDGWAELWFDDLAALQRSMASPAWQTLADDGATLFAAPLVAVIARERLIIDRDAT